MSSSIGLGVPIPKMLPITGTWTAPFAAYLLFLSNRVVYHRLKHEKYFGDKLPSTTASPNPSSPEADASGEPDQLFISTRAHANFLENVPLAFVLSAIAELNGANRKVLNYALAVFFVARVVHSELGLMKPAAMGVGRPIGYYGTQAFLAALGAWSTYLVKGYWGY